ncbi:hypothetical protein JQ633_29240 [Bradyrhizobium tropiciagri]|uniref:hypothetical protein n=1 Tax=Bradyrhizobium tropiciagri TaxID=312253 RepID=UPI001BAD94E7|nr:hypothetical protein [Bradyrhizobium tropiciagri]MBR0874473.1 hypothetical protein [Bradyrhizobium tropiciagri]
MEGEQATAANAAQKEETQLRQRSTIGFPYADLNAAVELANAIHSHVGSGECDDDQLAAWTGQSAKSSGFRTQIYAGRMFGVLEGEGSRHRLSELGRAIVDPNRSRDARSKAFQMVPLYRAIFESHRGGVIPPAAALEREMVGLGVAEKQKERARQVFERSADQAGYFEHGRNRLVMPGIASGAQREEEKPREEEESNGGGNGGGGGKPPPVDPIIAGLLARLPKSGDVWPVAERKLWLQLLEGSFQLIYKDAAANKQPVGTEGLPWPKNEAVK